MNRESMWEMSMKKILLIFLTVLMLFSCKKEESSENSQSQTSDRLLFAVIAMTFKNDYWQKVNYGCNLASFELGVDYYFDGMEAHTSDAYIEQIALVQRAIDMNVDGIMLSAIDKAKLTPIAEAAKNAKIPLITFDSGVEGDVALSSIATDNINAGAMAASQMKQAVSGGTVAVIANDLTSQTTTERVQGFMNSLSEDKRFLLLDAISCNGQISEAEVKFKQLYEANPELRAVFCTNSESAIGVANAIQSLNKAGEIYVIGFDSPPEEINFLEQNVIQGLIIQNPFLMGYNGISSLYNYIVNNVIPPKIIDTGVIFVTRDNLNDPNVIEAIYPLKK